MSSILKITSTYKHYAEVTPNKPAIVTEHTSLSYKDWYETVQHVARAFQGEKAENRRVALFLPNDVEFLQVFAGASEAGWASIVCDRRWKAAEIAGRMEQTEPDLVIADVKMKRKLNHLSIKVIYSDELEQWMDSKIDTYNQEEAGAFYIGFTSGSTGTPKAFIRSHASWIESFTCNRVDLGFTAEEHVLIPGSFVNSTFLYGALSALYDGATIYLLRKFSPTGINRYLEAYPITIIYVVPTMIQALIETNQTVNQHVTIISTGAKLLPSVKRNLRELYQNAKVHEFYGTSELSYITLLKDDDGEQFDASVGRPFYNVEVQIRKENGEEADLNEEGILYVKSGMIFDRYINNPTETSKVRNGEWATVSDIAKMDEDGYIYILGRKNDMILSGAYNIYPQEIEKVLREYHGVEEAAVVGVKDNYWGEKVAAFVQGDVSIQELKSYCLRNLSIYKIPRVWKKVNSFPLTTGGKISRRKLKESLEEGCYV